MTPEVLAQIIKDNPNITLSITAADLQQYTADIVTSVSHFVADGVVSQIKEVMGDKMKYCTVEEAMNLLGLKTRKSIAEREAAGMLTSLDINGRKYFLREEVLRIRKDKSSKYRQK